jgi:hypothetical protein
MTRILSLPGRGLEQKAEVGEGIFEGAERFLPVLFNDLECFC